MTNETITLLRETTDWAGDPTTEELGTFDVYLEEHSERELLKVEGDQVGVVSGSRGFFILFEDIDLAGDIKVQFAGRTFTIYSWSRFKMPGDGQFHHIEADFK
jgi:hypothetical protein